MWEIFFAWGKDTKTLVIILISTGPIPQCCWCWLAVVWLNSLKKGPHAKCPLSTSSKDAAWPVVWLNTSITHALDSWLSLIKKAMPNYACCCDVSLRSPRIKLALLGKLSSVTALIWLKVGITRHWETVVSLIALNLLLMYNCNMQTYQ